MIEKETVMTSQIKIREISWLFEYLRQPTIEYFLGKSKSHPDLLNNSRFCESRSVFCLCKALGKIVVYFGWFYYQKQLFRWKLIVYVGKKIWLENGNPIPCLVQLHEGSFWLRITTVVWRASFNLRRLFWPPCIKEGCLSLAEMGSEFVCLAIFSVHQAKKHSQGMPKARHEKSSIWGACQYCQYHLKNWY